MRTRAVLGVGATVFHPDQIGKIDGGTGRLAHATGPHRVCRRTGLFPRLTDHTCDLSRPPVSERDDAAATGTLEF